MPHLEARREIAYFMRRLYRQKLTTTSGGNISRRLTGDPHDGAIAVTPAATDKARTGAGDVAIVTLDGTNLIPSIRPTSEMQMHLRIYQRCPRVKAIVHAHPTTATIFTAAKRKINVELIAESYAILGQPLVAPYALTGTNELADHVADCAERANVILLENHGVTCLGRSLLEAFDRLELIEAAAQMTLIADGLGSVEPLSAARRAGLDRLMKRDGSSDVGA